MTGSPPAASAGKNLTTSSPSSIACSISPQVEQPGQTGTPFSMQYFTIFGLKPGETMNFAPASAARSTCSVVSTVPAPTSISGIASVMARIASAAAAVRNVTSAAGSPPRESASASGTALDASSILMTGIMPISPIFFKISFMKKPPVTPFRRSYIFV